MIARTEKEFIKPITIKELVLFTYQLKIGLFLSENTMHYAARAMGGVTLRQKKEKN